ncbi:diacylglycerol kinase beta isoform X2 [Ixodes scapularis]
MILLKRAWCSGARLEAASLPSRGTPDADDLRSPMRQDGMAVKWEKLSPAEFQQLQDYVQCESPLPLAVRTPPCMRTISRGASMLFFRKGSETFGCANKKPRKINGSMHPIISDR